VAARALRQCGRTSDGWSALAWMEKLRVDIPDTDLASRVDEILYK
jgi:hypothetical protein